jgi:hypothetical protein
MVVRVELLTDDELARCFRTFTPEPWERRIAASALVADGELVVETDEAELEPFIRAVLETASDDRSRLQLNGYHTSTEVRGIRMNKRFPGDFVSIDHPRYLEGVARALCFVGENDPDRRYRGRVLHAFLDSPSA